MDVAVNDNAVSVSLVPRAGTVRSGHVSDDNELGGATRRRALGERGGRAEDAPDDRLRVLADVVVEADWRDVEAGVGGTRVRRGARPNSVAGVTSHRCSRPRQGQLTQASQWGLMRVTATGEDGGAELAARKIVTATYVSGPV